jgi:Ca2+-binding EF-hand superfamily protein
MSISGIGSSGGFDVSKMASNMATQMVKRSDTNGDGSLDKSEFTKALTDMGVSADEASKKFDSIDKNKTGKISQSDIESDIKDTVKKGGGPSGGPPPGSAGKAGGSKSSSSTSYDVKDTNKDGTVSAAEELIYDMKHDVASSKNSDASVNQSAQSVGQNKVGGIVDVTV